MRLLLKFLILTFIICNFSSFAKTIIPDWNEGHVMLEGNEFFAGPVYLDSKNDVLLLKKGNQIKAYPAQKVVKLQFFDEELSINRDFVSYDLTSKNRSKRKIFLEIVLTGDITVLRKEKSFNYSLPEERAFIYNIRELDHHKNFIYYASIGGKLVELSSFNKKILPMINKNSNHQILTYKEANKLKGHILAHQIILIDFYNKLKDPLYKGLKENLTARN